MVIAAAGTRAVILMMVLVRMLFFVCDMVSPDGVPGLRSRGR